MIKVALLSEAGEKVGFGHISRIRALSYYLLSFGFEVQIYISPQKSFEPLEGEKLLHWCEDFVDGFDFYVIDSYIATALVYSRYSKSAPCLFFDDNFRIDYPNGMILNCAIGAENLYKKDKNHTYLLGEEYLLLRPEFVEQKREHREKIEKILIVLGANDIRDISSKIIKSIKKYNKNLQISQIITDSYKTEERGIVYHKNLDASEVASVMRESDVAICAGGQSLLELCALGVPTLSIQIADNQKNNIAYLEKYGLTTYLGDYEKIDFQDRISSNLKRLESKESRDKISSSLVKRFSKNGGQNIAEEIKRYYLDMKLKRNLTIQNLELKNFIYLDDDEKVEILSWRNSRAILENMINTQEIDMDSHLAFLDGLGDRSDKFYFKVSDIGVVTIEDIKITQCSFGIYKNPKSKKVGAILLSIAEEIICKKLKIDKIVIKVKEDNFIAQNLYKNHNYTMIEKREGLLIMQKGFLCQK